MQVDLSAYISFSRVLAHVVSRHASMGTCRPCWETATDPGTKDRRLRWLDKVRRELERAAAGTDWERDRRRAGALAAARACGEAREAEKVAGRLRNPKVARGPSALRTRRRRCGPAQARGTSEALD